MRKTREDIAPSEIMDTSVSVTPEQRDAARSLILKNSKNKTDAEMLLEIVGLAGDSDLIVRA